MPLCACQGHASAGPALALLAWKGKCAALCMCVCRSIPGILGASVSSRGCRARDDGVRDEVRAGLACPGVLRLQSVVWYCDVTAGVGGGRVCVVHKLPPTSTQRSRSLTASQMHMGGRGRPAAYFTCAKLGCALTLFVDVLLPYEPRLSPTHGICPSPSCCLFTALPSLVLHPTDLHHMSCTLDSDSRHACVWGCLKPPSMVNVPCIVAAGMLLF